MAKIAEVQEVAVSSLKPYERNAKIHGKEQIEKLKASILEFGFLTPCLIDRDNNIIAGHGRVMAASELGMQTVPCVYIEGLTEAQRRAYILADNRLGELGEWNMDIVDLELTELDDMNFDVSVTGFELPSEDDDVEITEDEVPEPPEEPKSKMGDIWQLGDHRLMCGDATVITDVEKLIDGNEIGLALTDPPYGISVVQSSEVGGGGALHFDSGRLRQGGGGNIVQSSTYMEVRGDDTTDTARDNYSIIRELTKNQIIFGGNYFTDFLSPSRCWIVWDKQNTGNFADAELAWTSFEKSVKLYHYMWNGLAREGSRKAEGVHRVHPTQKPVGLFGKILQDYSEKGECVLDCFGGSGTTLIACEQTGRKCFMMEYEPHYCDVIINRWETFTGREAVLING